MLLSNGAVKLSQLEDLKLGAAVAGILPNRLVSVVSVHWHGSSAVELTYKGPDGKVGNELLYRHDEHRIEIAERGALGLRRRRCAVPPCLGSGAHPPRAPVRSCAGRPHL